MTKCTTSCTSLISKKKSCDGAYFAMLILEKLVELMVELMVECVKIADALVQSHVSTQNFSSGFKNKASGIKCGLPNKFLR